MDTIPRSSVPTSVSVRVTLVPTMWNLYMVDCILRLHAEDVVLRFTGLAVYYPEQADDIAVISTAFIALQQKLHDLVV